MRKTTIFCLLTLWLSLHVQAQQRYYLETRQEPYVELTNPAFQESNLDTTGYFFDMGTDEFKAFGKVLPPAGFIGVNGFFVTYGPTNAFALDPMLRGWHGRDASSSVSGALETVNGEKVMKLQWKNLGPDSGLVGEYINFQLWVYQQSQVVEFRYGPGSFSSSRFMDGSDPATAGLFLFDQGFNVVYSALYVEGHPDSASLVTNPTRYLVSHPSNGTVYRFSWAWPAGSEPQVGLSPGQLLLYPNPVTGETLHLSQAVSGKILDMSGRELVHFEATPQINVNELTPGVYLLQTTDGIMLRFRKSGE